MNRRSRKLVVTMFLTGLLSFAGFGQSNKLTSNPAAKPKETKKKATGWEKTWYIAARLTGTFDSNFGHDPIATKSFGAIPAIETGYELKTDRQRWRFNYSIGVPHYTNFPEYNRRGQYFAAAYRYNFGKGFSAETEAEALLKGINEDRELIDQYIVTQNLGYKFGGKNKLNLYGAYRLKRRSADPDQDSNNPQIGLKYSRQLTSKLEWEIGYRYDYNQARGQRQRYVRRTFGSALNFKPTSRDYLSFEARYAPRLYARTVTVGTQEVPRSDKKWTFNTRWRHDLTSRFGFEAGYGYETRNSNDPDKIYNDHQVIVSLFYRWGNGKP